MFILIIFKEFSKKNPMCLNSIKKKIKIMYVFRKKIRKVEQFKCLCSGHKYSKNQQCP